MHGRSRGGLTTKIHALVHANGCRVPCNSRKAKHDGRSAAAMLGGFGPDQICWPIAPMTAMPSERRGQNKAPGPTLVPAKAGIKPMTGRVKRLPLQPFAANARALRSFPQNTRANRQLSWDAR
jgi:hypothetical protein